MIELKLDKLVVSFPELRHAPALTVDFQRTLRIPDDGKNYPLPPGLGSFPLRHIDEYSANVPGQWLKRGGVLLPMWQSEALWVSFRNQHIAERRAQYPFAVKVATGKINAITGETWRGGLSRSPQSYLVTPPQPWLDGYCVEKGVIRQFVAMPLGEGYTAEEQLTGQAEFGGLQIEVFPMRTEVFERRFPVISCPTKRIRLAEGLFQEETVDCCARGASAIGLAPGGRMRQEIYDDPYSIHDWDTEHGSRCFIHLVNSAGWHALTGQRPPSVPPTAQQYAKAGYPWFDYYDAELKALDGSKSLSSLKSVKEKLEAKRAQPLSDNQSVSVANIVNLHAKLKQHQVRESDFAS
jgi:hypothetical protein